MMCFVWFIREFRVFQQHIPLTKKTLLERINSDTPFNLRKNWSKEFGYLFIWTIIDRSSELLIGFVKLLMITLSSLQTEGVKSKNRTASTSALLITLGFNCYFFLRNTIKVISFC